MIADDGLRLRTALFRCADGRGSVVLSPGRTEPLEKYFEVVDELRTRGFNVLVHDWRGQGLSGRMLKDRMRGHAKGADAFVSDLGAVLAAHEANLPRPWVAIGHSMGGGLTALALSRGETRFAAAALSSPMLGLNLGGRGYKAARRIAGAAVRLGLGGRFATAWADPLEQPFKLNILTHDEKRWLRFRDQALACPDLRIGGPTWAWVSFALELSAELSRPGVVERIDTPMLVFAAGEEMLVDKAMIRAFAARAPDACLVELAGSRHEPFIETDAVRERLWAAFDSFLERQGL